MPNLTVALLLRAHTPDGKRPYLKPARAANGKLRPLWALYKDQPTHFPTGSYALRFKQGQRLVFEQVGSDLQVVQVAQRRKQNLLEAKALGNVVEEAESPTPRLTLNRAIESYLDDIAARKSLKTSNGYGYVLHQFESVCTKKHLDELSRSDMVAFIVDQRKKGMSDRTIFNRLGYIDTFLRSVGVPKLMPTREWPKFVEKKVTAYNREEIERLLADADTEERTLYSFFLGTGCREREVTYACWQDVDFSDCTFKVCAKPDFRFTPKDFAERIIPIPDELLLMLRERRQSDPKGRLIFPNGQGGPEGHFLRRLQILAWEAGLNCGDCFNKTRKSCADHPICRKWGLHKFRKSFASWHHEAGVPARTIQHWLGHSDLETTLAYLAVGDSRSTAVRAQVNKTFSALLRPRPILVA
jgi:integrase/recombinase XerD